MLYQFIHIDPQDSRTLQDQIKSDIAKAIFAGFVPKQTSIMSSRRLAEKLKVSRNTILRVYEQLAEEGVLVPIERKGYYVNPQLELSAPATTARSL
jgi:GntR family transcriptional regulator/MocR family aminotransferase